jgi:magnesium transporter
MNFEFMPELKIWWAYPAVLLLMLAVGIGMGFYFRKKSWL